MHFGPAWCLNPMAGPAGLAAAAGPRRSSRTPWTKITYTVETRLEIKLARRQQFSVSALPRKEKARDPWAEVYPSPESLKPGSHSDIHCKLEQKPAQRKGQFYKYVSPFGALCFECLSQQLFLP